MIRWAASRPAVVWAFGFALILAGAVSFTRLPLATKTQVELPRLSVRATWFGASAELIETYLTSPVEAAIQSVRGVRKTNSTSSEGSMQIQVELEPSVDVQLTRLGIHERMELLRNDRPPGASAPSVSNFVPEELSEQPLLRYVLYGPYTPGTLKRIVDEEIQPRISAVPGVSSVSSFGSAVIGVSVSYDYLRLRQLGISPVLLDQAIRGARMVRALGEERQGAAVRPVALRDQPRVFEDLEDLPIRAPSGKVFRLGELATIRPEEDTQGRFYRINGRTAIGLTLMREAGADAIHTARRVRAAMEQVKPLLPPAVEVRLEQDESLDLAEQLRDLVLRGAIAFAAVIMVLAITLRHFKSVWLVMGSAAVAIAGTALGLYLLEIPANMLTLAGLGMGIGIIAQNGLVVVERLRHAPPTPEGRAEAGRLITPAVIGATLTTAVVLFPFLYLQGNARAAFVPFASAFALALFWSVISALVMIPAVGTGRAAAVGAWPRLHNGYLWLLRPLVRWRWITIALTTVVLGVVTWGFVKKVPRSSWGNWFGERTTLNVSLSFPRGSDPQSLDLGMREFEAIAVGRPGIERVETSGGASERFGAARMVVTFTREAGLTALPALMQEEMTERAVLVGGASVGVQGQGPGFWSGGGGTSVSYRIKLLGYSFGGVERLAKDLQARLERIPRVRNVNINAGSFWGSDRAVSVALTPNRPALARAGLTAQQFSAAVGREVRGDQGTVRMEFEGEETRVALKARGARDRTLDQLRDALVTNTASSPLRVSDLALVGEREGLATINREDQQYVRIVGYDFRGPARLAQRTHDAFMKSITAPAGYSVSDQRFEWGEDESTKGLWLVFGAGVVLVILSVAMVFDSAWAAGIIFLSLPLALAGVAGIFWATGTAFSREAVVGVILVVGHAVNQTILLVDAALVRRNVAKAQRRKEDVGGGPSALAPLRLTTEEVLHAAGDRAGMIVLVTFTTLASLIPLAVGTDVDSLFGAIALATLGGMLAGTLGAMLVVPALIGGGRGRDQGSGIGDLGIRPDP